MRPIHLGIAVVALVLALAGLWSSVGRAPLQVRAASPFDPAADSDPNAADSAANEARTAAAHTGRTALPSATAADLAANAKEKAKPEKPHVTGRVVGPDDTGIAGATVWASTSQHWVLLPLDVEPEGLPARWITLKKVETDADGKFEIEELKPGPLRVAARASGFAPRYLEHLDLPPYEQHSIGDVKLERGVVVAGKVLDRDGKGVDGASVLIALDCVHRANLVALPGRGVPAGTTNAEGSFVVDQLACGPWHLIIDAPGYVIAEAEGKTERAGERQDGIVVRLESGVDIRGKIKAVDCALPSGLRVSARLAPDKRTQPGEAQPDQGQEEAPISTSNELRARYALVDADGSFLLRGLKVQTRYRLNVAQRVDDERGWKPSTSVDAQYAQGGDKGVELVYKPESVLVFRVLDDVSGTPITDMIVAAGIGRERALRDDKGEIVRTFEGGKVRFPELRIPAGGGRPIVLRVSANGYKDHENKNVPLKPGAELDLGDIRLQIERSVIASVVDDVDGKPVPNARVILCTKSDEELQDQSRTAQDQDMWGDTSLKYARTGADGKARLTSLPGKLASIQASAKGFLPSEIARVLLPSDADHALELRLKRGGTVIVKVTDGAGHAVAGVGVQHKHPRRAPDQDEETDEQRKTDSAGLVRYEALEPGVHGFQVNEDRGDVYFFDNEGQNTEEARWEEALVAAQSTKTIELTAPPRGSISGTIREGGQPLEGAHVKLVPRKENAQGGQGQAYWSGQNDPYATVSDHTGTYKFESLRCGEYAVLVTSAGRRMPAEFRATVSVEPHVFDFDLDLASIEGRVADTDGRALAGLTVNAYRAKGGLEIEPPYHMVVIEDERGNPNVNWEQVTHTTERTDALGRYVLKGLTTGEPLVVSVSGEWVEQGNSPEITLSPNEARRSVDFALHAAGKIEVTMLGTMPRGREGWFRVQVAKIEGDKDGAVVQQTYVGSWNRTQELSSIIPGRYKVTVRAHENQPGPMLLDQEVHVQAGQVSKVSFTAVPN